MGGGGSNVNSNSNSSLLAYPGQRALQQRQQTAAAAAAAAQQETPDIGSLSIAAEPVTHNQIHPGLNETTSSLPSTIPRTNPANSRIVIRGTHISMEPQQQQQTPTPISSSTPSETSRPGAYAVTRTADGPAQVFRVTVPDGVRPGDEFQVHAGSRRVRVRCPPTSRPGQSLQITLPPEPKTNSLLLKAASLTASNDYPAGGGASPMSPEVVEVNRAAKEKGGTAQTFLVTIPGNVYPGMQFMVALEGQRFMVTCPANAGPNMKVRIVPPSVREEPLAAPKTQVFEVVVPAGVRPGQPFTLMANEQRVLVTCPPGTDPGQKIRFQLPVQQIVGNIKLSYEGNAWQRTIRVDDLKFQWVRVQNNEVVLEQDGKVNFQNAAYVRKITFLEGNDARMRTGALELVPAQDAVVDSKLVVNSATLMSYADVATVQGKTLDEKTVWFQSLCSQLMGSWDDGHVKIVVRRSVLLHDSVEAIMALGRDDMRKRWRFEFSGEQGVDAGGLAREWFEHVSEQLFDPDRGLWLSSAHNQMCMTINPASNISCPDDHLVYYRFLGRVMGRALFDRQLIKGHMVRHLYKHLLGWPITFQDLEHEDDEYYKSLKKLSNMEDVSMTCLDFTATEETLGTRKEVELIPGGSMKEVTNENISDYLEANLKYRMLDRVRPQLTELLLGFFDVIPEPALSVFDHQEIELLLCGLPHLDMADWEANSIYSGLYEDKNSKYNHIVNWFWEVVRDDFDQETKARLLQFVTGTSGVPSRGFSVLQGNDGNIKKFAIHGVDKNSCFYPRAHTCFNRLDLPDYQSKKELEEKLRVAVTTSCIGFGIE